TPERATSKMEENNKSGFTAEGRKLRPRRPRISGKVYSSSEGPAERRSYNSEERHSGGSSYGRRAYGNSERRYGSSSYGNRPSGRSYNADNRGSYGNSSEGRSYNNGGSSERRSYGNGEGRSFGPSGRRASYGSSERSFERPSSGRPAGRRPFGSNEGGKGGNFGRPAKRGSGGRDNGARKGFKGGKPAGRNNSRPQAKPNPYRFNETDEKNMSMILSRKPQLDQIQLSDNDYVETPIKETIRLNKFIANSGICSRREADQYIQAGVVTVNGEVVTELGSKVNVLNDDIRFNGERIRGEEKVYIVMNKPKGFVTTASDPHAEKTVMDLLKNCSARVFPVGRLDKNTTGVLMFTNDGEIAERLTHPSYDKKKIYQVILDKPLAQEDYDKILEGISLSDGDIKADELEYIDAEDHRKLGIEIHSGKNRIVRRIFESLGYEVKALDRVYFAGLTKKGLKKGEWRYLSEGEANVLKMGAYV
ncbi:MAG: pseudouridine synthase, partial [Candidatus Cryptobacteroides sp.]|nr:pseudouridine synthase [Candidatus Cryptobacteroides sp.]